MIDMSRYGLTLLIALLATSRTATSFSSTSSTFLSTPIESETTTNKDDMYTSTQSDDSLSTDVPTTTNDIVTTTETFSKASSSFPTSEITSTESDTTVGDSSTTTVAPSTTADDSTAATDITTLMNIDTTTTEQETTTTDEQTSTDSITQFTDLTTSTASGTTTTVSISSTTAEEFTTSADPDTSPVTTSLSDKTTNSKNDATTRETINTTTAHSCQNRDVFTQDNVSSFAIIALSIALGILSISVIAWCLISRLFINANKSKISTGTQTDFFISKEIYVRPLPPVDTYLKKRKPSKCMTRNACFTEKRPLDIRVDIIPEYPLEETKVDIISDRQYTGQTYEYDQIKSSKVSLVTNVSFESNQDKQSMTTDDTISSDDLEKTQPGELFYTDSGSPYSGKEDHDSTASDSELQLLTSDTESSSFDQTDKGGERDLGSDKIFVHITSVSGLDQANDKPAKNKADMISQSLNNEKPYFQSEQYIANEDDLDEQITLADETTPVYRQVTIKEPRSLDADQGDFVFTLTSPKYKCSGRTKSNESSAGTTLRKRKRVRKEKEGSDKTALLSHARSRYLATYGIMSSAFFEPELIEAMTIKRIRQIEAKNRKKIKAKYRRKKKSSKPRPEPMFQSEPYHSLYSKLSHFENGHLL